MRKLLPAAALAALSALAVAQSPLTTTYVGGNAGGVGGAVFFDLNVAVPITVTGLDVSTNTALGTPGSIEVYTCSTTYLGNEANLAAWTLVSSGNVTSAGPGFPGPGVPSTVAISPFPLPVGTVGIALKGINQAFAYTNGTGTNQTYSTAELTLTAGAAQNIAFTGAPFTPRVFNGAISYSLGTSGTVATRTNYGTGCVGQAASFYEHFTTTPSIDLSNSAFSMLFTGTGYLVLPSTATFLAPSATATNLNLGDDTETTITLSTALNYPGGSTTSLNVGSNGHISTASNGAAGDYTPTPAEMINWANTSWTVWRDFICNTTGNVFFEEVGGIAYITWNGVVGYAGTATGTTPSTFQFQFHLATGNIDVVFQSMDTVSVSGWAGGEGWVVGYSPGGASLNPGSVDLTTAVPATINLPATDTAPLALAASARPLAGTTINLDTSNIPAGAPFGAILLGFTQFNPGLDLTGIGMAGCQRYNDGSVTLLYLPLGSSSNSLPFAVPNAVGFQFEAQSVAYAPGTALTVLGAISSNGTSLFIGNL